MSQEIERAAAAIARAKALVIAAGAGMGVDSGLPDFRGDAGFWRAYPAYARLGLGFSALANPRWFRNDPELAWGFYGHRIDLYRRTTPHPGFTLLRAWAGRPRAGHFVFTSNVDGHFQRAGFDATRVLECHGSLDALQCVRGCAGLFPADGVAVDVDPGTFRARGALPACPRCGGLARPNVLMFGDGDFDDARTREQEARLAAWLETLRGSRQGEIVVVECGAGTAVPSVRSFSERMVRGLGATLVRINVREPEVPAGQVGLAVAALPALQALDALVTAAGPRR